MITIPVQLHNGYEITIGEKLLPRLGEMLLRHTLPCKIMLVTDDVVEGYYANETEKSLTEAGFTVTRFVMENGEENKTVDTYLKLVGQLAEQLFHRGDMVVALGGGVVGDVAGFAAATYMRGIKVVQVPTTLLAGIDASIGGKTAVDLFNGKNMLGAFHQPTAVYFDLKTLATLDDTEFRCGVGEGIKYAVLCGGELFDILEQGLSYGSLSRFTQLCAQYKAQIVMEDEKEKGSRALLNLGHTLGHAYERASGYAVPHGEAVAMGVLAVATASNRAGKLDLVSLKRIKALLEQYGIHSGNVAVLDGVMDWIRYDKKCVGEDSLKLVDINAIGDCIVRTVTLLQLEEYFKC